MTFIFPFVAFDCLPWGRKGREEICMKMELLLWFPLWIYMGYSILYWGLRGNFIKVHLGRRQHMRSAFLTAACGFSAALGKKKITHASLHECRRSCLSGTWMRFWQNELAVWLLRKVYPMCSPWIAQRKPEEVLGVLSVLPRWNITLAPLLECLHAFPNLSYKKIKNLYNRHISHP